jgi:hypothetical protein
METGMNHVSEFLRAEIGLVVRSKALGLDRKIEHAQAMLAYERAAQEIEALHDTLNAVREAMENEPAMQNRDKYLGLGMQVNKALGRS